MFEHYTIARIIKLTLPLNPNSTVSTNNPWKTLHSEEKYDNPWITVTKSDVITPGGSPGEYGVVHFKNLAIGVVPIDENGFTWLVGQYRYPLERYTWEIPEGGGPLNAEPLESAKRELREETGLVADKWTLIQEMDLSNSATDERALLYVAQDLKQFEPEPDENEDLALVKVPFEEVYERVRSGELRDSLTVAAILKIKLMQHEGTIKL